MSLSTTLGANSHGCNVAASAVHYGKFHPVSAVSESPCAPVGQGLHNDYLRDLDALAVLEQQQGDRFDFFQASAELFARRRAAA